MRRRRLACGILLAASFSSRGAVEPGAAQAPRLEYQPLPAGSYELQRIQAAPDAWLLDAQGRRVRLSPVCRGKVTLLTFFYTYCVDPLGCPFAYRTLSSLRDRLMRDRQLSAGVRFVSISFDPSHDTPEALRRYGADFIGNPGFEWQFLTARSVPELMPVLNDLGQDVSVQLDENGRPTRTLHHMLKMFLLDRDGVVREIYTLAYLQPEVMFNDIRTLLMEKPSRGLQAPARRPPDRRPPDRRPSIRRERKNPTANEAIPAAIKVHPIQG
jgi:cytochrome oxidase Cu insertion factor (SCO1/SenC/PrrC family)